MREFGSTFHTILLLLVAYHCQYNILTHFEWGIFDNLEDMIFPIIKEHLLLNKIHLDGFLFDVYYFYCVYCNIHHLHRMH